MTYISAKEPYISAKLRLQTHRLNFVPRFIYLQIQIKKVLHLCERALYIRKIETADAHVNLRIQFHLCVDTNQQSPTYPQKSLTYPQKSHTYLPNCDCRRTGQYSHPAHVCVDTNQNSPTSPQKSPTYPQKSHTCPPNCDCRAQVNIRIQLIYV